LSTTSGLSAACIRSRGVQSCDNTDADPRVDAVACRRLGVQSLVVVPLLKESEVVGILEIFSPRPYAFTESEVQTLLVLSRRIMDTMMASAEKEETISSAAVIGVSDANIPTDDKDYWTPVLTVLVVGLALLLGWMLGHRGWGKTVAGEKVPSMMTVPVTTKSATPIPNEASPPSSPVARVSPTGAVNPKAPITIPGGLMVYENGKLVFQVNPVPGSTHSEVVQISPSTANSLLIERVEPQYPESARLAHIQGAVVLQVDVNQKGTVQELRTLDGDPQLVMAAMDAVRQWHFKPYKPRGQAVNFETQITVEFKLP